MRKAKAILPIGIFLIICLIVFIALIKDKVPKNIFCFLDIGTYRTPPATIEINSSNICGQSFVSNFDNLFMISVFIPRQELDRDGELLFHLKKDKKDNKDLVTLKWRLNQIRFLENDFYVVPPDRESSEEGFHFHFKFPPISGSKNEEFYLYFESPDARPGKGIKLGVWNDRQYYEGLTKGKMFINDKPVKGFLAFRTYNTWSKSVKDVFNEICSRLSKDVPFSFFYGCLIFVTFVGSLLIKGKR